MVEEGRGLSRRPIANLPQEKRQQPGLVPSSENNADATTLEAWTLLLVPNSPAFHEYRQRIDGAGLVFMSRQVEREEAHDTSFLTTDILHLSPNCNITCF